MGFEYFGFITQGLDCFLKCFIIRFNTFFTGCIDFLLIRLLVTGKSLGGGSFFSKSAFSSAIWIWCVVFPEIMFKCNKQHFFFPKLLNVYVISILKTCHISLSNEHFSLKKQNKLITTIYLIQSFKKMLGYVHCRLTTLGNS